MPFKVDILYQEKTIQHRADLLAVSFKRFHRKLKIKIEKLKIENIEIWNGKLHYIHPKGKFILSQEQRRPGVAYPATKPVFRDLRFTNFAVPSVLNQENKQ